MKNFKLFGLGLLLSITFLSCSKDEESTSSPTSLILPKKIIYTDGKDAYFNYDGNKIVSEIYDGQYKSVYTYTGDLITKVERFYYAKLTSTIDYTYTNGKITSMLEKEPPYTPIMTNFVHNTDGTILYSSGNQDKGKLTFKDGNLIEWNMNINTIKTYEYDTKNNPFKNILGYSALSGITFQGFKNNIIKETVGGESGKNIITYNTDGYPIEDHEYWNGSSGGTTKYYYE